MTFTRIFDLRFISLTFIAIVIWICHGYSQSYAKSEIPSLSCRIVFTPDSARDSSTNTDIQNAEQLVAAHPSAANYLSLSFAYYQGNRYQDCIAASRSAIGLRPDYAEAYNNIAVGYQGLARWDSAIMASNEAVRLSPGYQLAQNNLTWEISQKKLLYDNVDSAEKAVAANPTPENYVQLSLTYYLVGRDRDCVVAANKALVLRPDYAIAWNNMSAAYIALSEWDFAIVAGNEALRTDPTSDLAKNNLSFAVTQNNLRQSHLVR
jgi:tetratricopeptide (TPR) repeat protein